MNVEMVRWPADSVRLAELRDGSLPRLLVVADDADPLVPVDCLEDWVTANATEREVDARRDALAIRCAQHAVRPALDDDGLLHHRDAWVSLSPVEQSLASAM